MSELETIFGRVSVCRTFRLEGLQEILKRTDFQGISAINLIWQIGDLSARGYITGTYIVDHERAEATITRLENPLPCHLHNRWKAWRQSEFKNKLRVDDLAELLYHDASCFKEYKQRLKSHECQQCLHSEECKQYSDTKGNVLDYIEAKTKEYLLYYKQSDNTSQEIRHYIHELIKIFQLEELDRINWIFSDQEYQAFVEFLNSPNLLN